jgi:hypothetical protein
MSASSARDVVISDEMGVIGFVRRIGDVYVAYGADGRYRGRYASQLEATRSIPEARRRRRGETHAEAPTDKPEKGEPRERGHLRGSR